MVQCTSCRQSEFEQALAPQSLEVGEYAFTTQVPAQVCGHCGEKFFEARALERFELLAAVELANSGTGSKEALRFMRKVLGLRASELAELLDVTPETMSRWENGKLPVERRAFALLGLLVADKLEGRTATLERLQALRHPRPPSLVIRLELVPA